MEWLYKHLGVTVGGAVLSLVAFAVLFRKPVSGAFVIWKAYRKAQATIHETDKHLVDGYQELTELQDQLTAAKLTKANAECEDLKREVAELKQALRMQVMATMTREDINRQAGALIRALTRRLREERIDFSDIDKAIRREFESE